MLEGSLHTDSCSRILGVSPHVRRGESLPLEAQFLWVLVASSGTWLWSQERCQEPKASPSSLVPLCMNLPYSHLISGFEIQPLALRPKIDVRLSLHCWRLLSM